VYVAAPPEIWRLTDADDDGQAEARGVWFDGQTLTGCGNDLHGPYLGRDGWFYWCKGAWAEQRHTLGDGREFRTRAAHIFRARPDGRGLEPVLTAGMDNPVGVAFLSTGERILSCTFLQHPEAGRRDGLIHAIYGGVYGKTHDATNEFPQTGSLLPVLSHQGPAAPCGVIAGGPELFGGGHADQVFACYFNLRKVVQHELVPDGATFTTRDVDLLACDHPDFHPTDVLEDADGSLLIVDTGGWYKVCCPTSQLAKPDVLGAIYRLRKSGQPRVEARRAARLVTAERRRAGRPAGRSPAIRPAPRDARSAKARGCGGRGCGDPVTGGIVGGANRRRLDLGADRAQRRAVGAAYRARRLRSRRATGGRVRLRPAARRGRRAGTAATDR
jgi:hypothetical protein